MAEGVSRIAEARRRAAGAKQTAVAVAVAGFLAIAFLAKQSHPAKSSSASQTSNVVVQEDDGGFSLSPGTIAPGGGSGGGAQTTVS